MSVPHSAQALGSFGWVRHHVALCLQLGPQYFDERRCLDSYLLPHHSQTITAGGVIFGL